MSQSTDPIVCRPTRWFLLRAVVMLVMFGGFALWFAYDAAIGYRAKNLRYFLHDSFRVAGEEFARLSSEGSLSAADWRQHAAERSVRLPDDRSTIPADVEIPLPWPGILHDFEQMKSRQWNQLWLDYAKEHRLDSKPPEKPHDAGSIREQWWGAGIGAALALVAAFFLLRTMRRSLRADDEGVCGADGKRVRYEDLKKLDLRKWETKGLAFLEYEGASGRGRFRLDGLTYGGFKKEDGEPAERLMKRIRSRFSGEILEYVPLAPEPEHAGTVAGNEPVPPAPDKP